MKDRPISYSPPMVRARRAGLKTQTRRVCKPAEGLSYVVAVQDPNERGQRPPYLTPGWFGDEDGERQFFCPYGQPGDRLWVKEEHYLFGIWRIDGKRANGKPKYRFEADQDMGTQFDDELNGMTPNGLITGGRSTDVPGWYKRVGMFMPRWASRSLDEIVSVRVERLQDISEADAIAEGVTNSLHLAGGRFANENYAHLWDQINGDGEWEKNPWVWVIEFKVVTA